MQFEVFEISDLISHLLSGLLFLFWTVSQDNNHDPNPVEKTTTFYLATHLISLTYDKATILPPIAATEREDGT